MSKAEIENENISEIVFRKAKRKRICKKKIVKKQYNKKTIKKQKTSSIVNPWLRPVRKPNSNEVKKMFGIALQRLILICMTNHVYMFNNVARLQVNGGDRAGFSQ